MNKFFNLLLSLIVMKKPWICIWKNCRESLIYPSSKHELWILTTEVHGKVVFIRNGQVVSLHLPLKTLERWGKCLLYTKFLLFCAFLTGNLIYHTGHIGKNWMKANFIWLEYILSTFLLQRHLDTLSMYKTSEYILIVQDIWIHSYCARPLSTLSLFK